MKKEKCPMCRNTGMTNSTTFCTCESGIAARELDRLLPRKKAEEKAEEKVGAKPSSVAEFLRDVDSAIKKGGGHSGSVY